MGDVKRLSKKSWNVKKQYQLHKKRNYTFYNSSAWRKYRKLKLEINPHCEECIKKKQFVPGYYVDHIKPINEEGVLFPPFDELMTLCISCDARKRQKEAQRSKGANK